MVSARRPWYDPISHMIVAMPPYYEQGGATEGESRAAKGKKNSARCRNVQQA